MQPTISQIKEAVCQVYGVKPVHLVADFREDVFTEARWVVMYLAREMAGATKSLIGRSMRRDRSTVYYGLRQISWILEHDGEARQRVARVKHKLRYRLERPDYGCYTVEVRV